jgi:hypothetical protein
MRESAIFPRLEIHTLGMPSLQQVYWTWSYDSGFQYIDPAVTDRRLEQLAAQTPQLRYVRFVHKTPKIYSSLRLLSVAS